MLGFRRQLATKAARKTVPSAGGSRVERQPSPEKKPNKYAALLAGADDQAIYMLRELLWHDPEFNEYLKSRF